MTKTTDQSNRIAVFTGHRDVLPGHTELIRQGVIDIAGKVDEFVFGGATGGDTIALGAVCDLAEAGKPFPRIHVVVAARVYNQPSDAQAMIGRAILLGATVEEMRLPYNAESLKDRNRRMIDRITDPSSGIILAYWRGIQRSGTYSAMAYATRRGVSIQQVLQ